MTAILVAAFAEIWIHRPIWKHGERALTAYSVLQVALYGVLLALSPGFAVLQVLIYPQDLFSLSLIRSVAAAMTIGLISAADTLAVSNGDIRAALPSASYAILVAFMFTAMAVVNRDAIAQSFERRALINELTSARREAAAAERAAGVAQERARLAREIHDTLTRAHLAAAEETARASLAEARTLVWALRPEAIAEGGLPAAIRRVAMAASGPSGPSVEATVSGSARQLHTEVEVTLLRAAQQGLANARRHAAATHIDLTLTYFDDVVTLDVADDGCGFNPAQASKGGGLGLRGMRERAEGLGGTLVIESAPGEGTTVALSLAAIEAPRALDEIAAEGAAEGHAIPAGAREASGSAAPEGTR